MRREWSGAYTYTHTYYIYVHTLSVPACVSFWLSTFGGFYIVLSISVYFVHLLAYFVFKFLANVNGRVLLSVMSIMQCTCCFVLPTPAVHESFFFSINTCSVDQLSTLKFEYKNPAGIACC